MRENRCVCACIRGTDLSNTGSRILKISNTKMTDLYIQPTHYWLACIAGWLNLANPEHWISNQNLISKIYCVRDTLLYWSMIDQQRRKTSAREQTNIRILILETVCFCKVPARGVEKLREFKLHTTTPWCREKEVEWTHSLLDKLSNFENLLAQLERASSI